MHILDLMYIKCIFAMIEGEGVWFTQNNDVMHERYSARDLGHVNIMHL